MQKAKLGVALGTVVALVALGMGSTGASASSPTSNSGASGSAAVSSHVTSSSAGTTADPSKVYPQPNKKYKKKTCLADESGADFTTTTSLALQGKKCKKSFKVTFSGTMERRTVPNGGWASWNIPPFVESSTPRVFFTGGADAVTLTFSSPTAKAGIEIEPDEFTPPHNMLAVFHTTGGDKSIQMDVSGQGGALLFGLKADPGDKITSIDISDTHAAGTLFDFAIAKIRAQR